MPVTVIDIIIPQNSGQFPVVEDVNIKGGYQVQPTVAEMDAIFTADRKQGMLVYVVADSTFYQLAADLITWNPVTLASVTLIGDVNGPSGANLVQRILGQPLPNLPVSGTTYLSWNGSTFSWSANSGGITQLTGDVTAGPGSGSVPTTIAKLQGITLNASTPINGQVLAYNGTDWAPQTPSSGFTAGGDLSGTSSSQTVIGIEGHPIILTSLASGQVLQYNGTDWVNVTPSASGSAGGDLTGTYPNPTLAKIQGKSLPAPSGASNVLFYNGSALSWSATSNIFTAGGDLTGTATNQTVQAVQGFSVSSVTPLAGDTLIYNGSQYVPSVAFEASGDLSGTNISQTVVGLQDNPIKNQGLLGVSQDGYVLTWYAASGGWQAQPNTGGGGGGGGNFVAGGDLSGSSVSQTVVGIQGIPVSSTMPTSGQVLEYNGTQWAPTSGGGGGGITQLTGDVTAGPGSGSVAATVVNIHGASVPTAGGLVTGNVLQVSGTSSLSYAPVDLAGGSHYVTGVLPASNQAAQTMGGDLSGTTAAATVAALQGTTLDVSPAINNGALISLLIGGITGGVSSFYYDSVTGYLWMGSWTSTYNDPNYSSLVFVVDTAGPSLVATITGSLNVRWIRALVGDSNYVYACSPNGTQDNLVAIISKSTYQTVGLLQIGATGEARDMCFDTSGNLYVTDNLNSNLVQFTPTDIANAVSNYPTPQSPTNSPLNFPNASSVETCCFDTTTNHVWVTAKSDSGGAGSPLYQVSTSLVLVNTAWYGAGSDFDYFHGIAFYQGYLWISTDSSSIIKVDPTAYPAGGAFTQIVTASTSLSGDIYVDTSTSTILVQDQGSGSPVITRVNAPAGTIASTIALSGGPHGYITGFATSSSQLWIADRDATLGVYLYSNTVGSETETELFTGQTPEIQLGSPVMWYSNGTLLNTSQTDMIRYFNVIGSGFNFTKQSDPYGNEVATLDLTAGGFPFYNNSNYNGTTTELQLFSGQANANTLGQFSPIPYQYQLLGGTYSIPYSVGSSIQIIYVETNYGNSTIYMPIAASTPYGGNLPQFNGYTGSGYWIRVVDDYGLAATYNITVNGNGYNIEDPNSPGTYSGSVTLSKNSCAVTWEWTGSHWKIFSSFYGSASSGITALTGDVTASGSGSVVATVTGIQAVTISGTAPTTGQVLTATSGTAANWQTPSGGSGYATIQQNGTSETARTKLNFLNSVSIADDSTNASTDVTIVHADNQISRRSFNRHRLRTTGFTGTQFGTNGFIRYAMGVTGSLSSNCWEGTNVGIGAVTFGEYLYFSGSQYENSTYDYPNSTIWGLDTLTGNSLSLSGVPVYVPYALGNFNSDLGTMAHATVNVNQAPFSGPYDFVFTGNTGGTNGGYVELGYMTPFEGYSAPQTTVASGSNGVSVGTYASSSQSVTSGTINVFDTTGFPSSGTIIAQTLYNGPVSISYTGTSGGTSFTGCTTSGTGTIPQDGQITPGSLVINVATTAGFPSSGTLQVLTSYGLMLVGYTGTSGGNQFTGCYVNGPNSIETMATGNLVTLSGYTRLFRQLGNGGGIWTGPIKCATSIGFTKAKTTLTAGSNGSSLPQSTIYVSNTNGFPFSGSFWLTPGTSGTPQLITYTGKTSTTFTGCSGGTGTMATGNVVTADVPPCFAFIDGSYHVWIVAPDGSASEVISSGFSYNLIYDDNGYLWVAATNSLGTTVTLTKYPLSANVAAYPAFPVTLGSAAATRTCSNTTFEGYTSAVSNYGIADPYGGGLTSDGKYIWGLAGNADQTAGNQSWLFAYDMQTAALVKTIAVGYDSQSFTNGTTLSHRIWFDGETIWLSAVGYDGSYGVGKFVKLLNIHPESGEILFNSGVLSNTSTIPSYGSLKEMVVTDGGEIYMFYTSTNTSAGNGNDLAMYRASANANTLHAHSINLDRLPGGFGGLQSGSVTLSSGTATVSTGITINSTSTTRVMLTLTSPSGTLGAHYEVTSLVAGVPGTGSFTVNSVNTSGATVTTDNSTLNYLIVG